MFFQNGLEALPHSQYILSCCQSCALIAYCKRRNFGLLYLNLILFYKHFMDDGVQTMFTLLLLAKFKKSPKFVLFGIKTVVGVFVS